MVDTSFSCNAVNRAFRALYCQASMPKARVHETHCDRWPLPFKRADVTRPQELDWQVASRLRSLGLPTFISGTELTCGISVMALEILDRTTTSWCRRSVGELTFSHSWNDPRLWRTGRYVTFGEMVGHQTSLSSVRTRGLVRVCKEAMSCEVSRSDWTTKNARKEIFFTLVDAVRHIIESWAWFLSVFSSKMWHEARRQERKLRGIMVDFKKRAERRRAYYERMVGKLCFVCFS